MQELTFAGMRRNAIVSKRCAKSRVPDALMQMTP
jgi:hypothetical protein